MALAWVCILAAGAARPGAARGQPAALAARGPAAAQRARRPTALRAGGQLCPCPTGPRAVSPTYAVDELPAGARLPRLVVFDLDNTLWTPELYTLRHVPGYADVSPPGPVPDRDVWLVDGAVDVLHELATSARWRDSGVRVAAASRTNKGPWARALLDQFCVPVGAGQPPAGPLSALIPHVEIRPGSKVVHFKRLAQATAVPYEDMLFFDDARGGKFGNCEAVASLGVLSVHTPRGLTRELFASALREFAARKAAGASTAVVLPLLAAERRPPASAAPAFFPAGQTVRLRCFSMNAPFAPLLAAGLKTIESRNGSMFAGTEGEVMLLHCGRRVYPDGGEHRRVLAEAGMDAQQVAQATSLPPAFAPGQLIAIVQLGATALVDDVRERSRAEVERGVVARGAAMGKYHTTIRRAAWLRSGVAQRGQPGLFSAEVPLDAIPAEARAWLAARPHDDMIPSAAGAAPAGATISSMPPRGRARDLRDLRIRAVKRELARYAPSYLPL